MAYKDPEVEKAYHKARYERNKEKIKAQQKDYRERNKEKIKAQRKDYRERNRAYEIYCFAAEVASGDDLFAVTKVGQAANWAQRLAAYKNVGVGKASKWALSADWGTLTRIPVSGPAEASIAEALAHLTIKRCWHKKTPPGSLKEYFLNLPVGQAAGTLAHAAACANAAVANYLSPYSGKHRGVEPITGKHPGPEVYCFAAEVSKDGTPYSVTKIGKAHYWAQRLSVYKNSGVNTGSKWTLDADWGTLTRFAVNGPAEASIAEALAQLTIERIWHLSTPPGSLREYYLDLPVERAADVLAQAAARANNLVANYLGESQ